MSSDDAFPSQSEPPIPGPTAGPPAVVSARPPGRPHPNVGWAFLWCIGFLLFTQLLPALAGVVVIVLAMVVAPEQFPKGPPGPDELMRSPVFNLVIGWTILVSQLLVIGVSWLVLRLVAGRDWPRQVALRAPGLAHLALVLAAFPAMVLLADGSYYVLRHVVKLPSFADLGLPGMEQMVKMFSRWPWAFAVLVIGLGPGLGEELWCRGFLGRGLVGRHGVVLGVLFASLYFGLIHLDPCQGTMAALMGLWLHFTYLTTRSLWVPILLHFLNNSLAVLVSRHPVLQVLEQDAGSLPWPLYLAAGVLLLAVAWALYGARARLVALDGAALPLWRPAYPGVEYPPAGSGTRVAHPVPGVLTWAVVGAAFLAFLGCAAWAFRLWP